jgi:4-carboxymuconolactone decarboxylase
MVGASNRELTQSDMPRLPFVDPSGAPDSIREVISDTPLSLLRMVAHAQSAFDPWLKYGAALLTRLELNPLLREFAILQVAHLIDSRYEWVQHAAIARSIGASDQQLAAIEEDRDEHPSLSHEQRQVLRFARDVVLDGTASEQEVVELAQRLGPRQVIELLLVIGHYLAIARLIATTGLEADPPLVAGRQPAGQRE